MSLTNDIKTNKRKTTIKRIFIVFLLFGGLYFGYFYFFNKKEIPEIKKEEKIANVTKQTIKTFIEADGKIVLKNELNLDFVGDGIIKKIYKNPGDYIKKGEKIASIDSEYLDIAIKKAEISLKTAKSNYEIKKKGISQTEIDISQKQLNKDNISLEISQKEIDLQINSLLYDIEIAKKDFEIAKKESQLNLMQSENILNTTKIDYDNSYNNLEVINNQEEEKYNNTASKLVMETGQMITNLEKYLYDIDMILGISDTTKYQNDSFEMYLGAKNTALKSDAENSYRNTKVSFDNFYLSWQNYRKDIDLENFDSYDDLNKYVFEIKEISQNINKSINYTIEVLKNSVISSTLSQLNIDNYINSFENILSQSKNDSANYMSLYQNLQETKTSWEAKILSLSKEIQTNSGKIVLAESSLEKVKLQNDLDIEKANQKILDLENKLKETEIKKENTLILSQAQTDISQANLENKKYSDNSDLEPFYMSILQAEESLKEAQQKKQDSLLYSPINGKIAKINGQIGESTNSLKEPFVVIIDDNSFFVECYVEETDIVKIKNNQDVYISFDAIDGLVLNGKVFYIEDKATFDSNGLVSYKVEILFSNNNDKRIKEAMSVTGEFITKEIKNVLSIPVSAVKNISGKPSVIMQNGNIHEVVTGFTDGKIVEVISGLQNGEKVKY